MAARHDVSAGLARRIRIAALVSLASALAGTASAYDQPTHILLSQEAFNSSIMDVISFEYGIGAFGINNDGSLKFQQYPDTKSVDRDLYALVQAGAYYEDEGRRSLNHFFNPVNGQPLPAPIFTTYTSPDWALEDNGQLPDQNNSLADARQYYWTALTASDPQVRSTNFGLMYQSLGQVIHHIQDMAQPQHARDEAHCNAFWGCAVPGYVLGYYHPSGYESYMLLCTFAAEDGSSFGNCPSLSGNYPAVFDQNNPSTYGRFPLARNFWTESGSAGNNGSPGYGIAEYTNAGFVGARTNFKGLPLALLPADPVALPLPNGTGATVNQVPLQDPSLFGASFPVGATMTFISTPVTDHYTNTTDTNPRASTFSIFTNDLEALSYNPVFSVNDFTYSSAGALLIPRAIGYSAGLLNYFFRGELGVSLPHEGVYGIVDQAQQYSASTTTDVSGNTQGFHVIKVALTNASPDGEAMQNGTLAAVLRYRRNDQYVDTLEGEPGSPGNGSLSSRGSSDEYVVSGAVKDAGGNVVSPGQVQLTSQAQEFEFDFPNALPLNSTDVYLQVVYKGDLGAEKGTAVVSSTVDLSEPTYLNVFNSLDYISINGQYLTEAQVNADPSLLALVRPQNCVNYNVQPPVLVPSCFSNTKTIPVYLDAHNTAPSSQSLVSLQQLPVGGYARLAVLTNAFGSNASFTLNFASICDGGSLTVNALNNEIAITSPASATLASTVQETADVSNLDSFRGILGWFNLFCVWDGDGSAQATGDPTKMTALSGNGIYPVPVNITFPQPQ